MNGTSARAALFFRLVYERCEGGPVMLTSDERFSDRAEFIGDDTPASGFWSACYIMSRRI